MIVLAWDQVRRKILGQLASVDASVAKRIDGLHSAWQTMHDSAQYLLEETTEAQHQNTSDTGMEQRDVAPKETWDQPEIPPKNTIPDYLL